MGTVVGLMSVAMAISCWASATTAQVDLITSSHASLSKTNVLTLDGSAPSSYAYALYAPPLPLSPSFATFYDFSIDNDFRNGAIAFIITPDSNISSHYPTVYADPSIISDADRFAFAINLTYNSTDSASFVVPYNTTSSIFFLEVQVGRTSLRQFRVVLEYTPSKNRSAIGLNGVFSLSQFTSTITKDLSSVLKKPTYVGLLATGGGVFRISYWSVLIKSNIDMYFTAIAQTSSSSRREPLVKHFMKSLLIAILGCSLIPL